MSDDFEECSVVGCGRRSVTTIGGMAVCQAHARGEPEDEDAYDDWEPEHWEGRGFDDDLGVDDDPPF